VSVNIEVTKEAVAWKQLDSAETIVRSAVAAVLADAGVHRGEVSVVLCDDARIRELNRIWRGKDESTNVLSFPANKSARNPVLHFGDIVLAYETLVREAEAEGKTIEAHLSHLGVHGMLHLLGEDHENDCDAEVMEERERRILARLGISDPNGTGQRLERNLA
jgi:probable rRNA maturation factor